MRKRYALKNVIAKASYATIYAILSFVTRKLFIIYLGDTILGLSSVMASILSMLSLMELGVGRRLAITLLKRRMGSARGMMISCVGTRLSMG